MKEKIALVTGASSGIGRDIAHELDKRGYSLILCARREDRLLELKNQLKNAQIITKDLNVVENCIDLYNIVKDKNISVLINCAGFGDFGKFCETNINKELSMIDVNVKALHILCKLFLKDFKEKDEGYILNVASSAGLMPAGPYMATYYATKSYVTSLTLGIAQELKEENSHVYVGALCPGPVDTEFNAVAGVKFGIKSISSQKCANYAVKKMFKRKTIIVPLTIMKLSVFGQRFVTRKFAVKIAAKMQKKKQH